MSRNPYKKAHDERARIVKAIKALVEHADLDGGREFTADEQTQYSQLKVDLAVNASEIDRAERAMAEENEMVPGGDLTSAPTSAQVAEFRAGLAGERSPRRRQARIAKATYAELFGPPSKPSGFESFEAFLKQVHSGYATPALLATAGFSGAGEQTDSSGGFLVPEIWAAGLLDKALESEIVRPRARIEPMESSIKKVAGFDRLDNSTSAPAGFTGQWIGESTLGNFDIPKIRLIQLTARKLAIFTTSSNELVADGTDFENMLGQQMIAALSWHLDVAFLVGQGGGKPLGVLYDPALITVAKQTGQPAATIVYENLVAMFGRMHPACISNAVWVCQIGAAPQLLQLQLGVGTGGLAFPTMALKDDGSGGFTIMGRPVIFSEKLPALGQVGDIIFADFSQYVVGMRKEVSLEKTMHLGFQSDQSAYRTICRVDGLGSWSKPFTPKAGATLSWVVTLAAR